MTTPRLRFVGSSRGNLFITELLEIVAEGARDAGADAEVVLDALPPLERDLVYVVVPHELLPLISPDARPSAAQLAQTVALCVEQPETFWFGTALEHALQCGAALDISRVGAAALRANGLAAGHLQLGYTPRLDGWGGDAGRARPTEILYMGSAAPRRERHLSAYADVLGRRESLLMIPPYWVKPNERPDFLVGDAKRRRIASAELMLSVGRLSVPYFEWVRALDAICSGAVFLCDHARGAEPLTPGAHFVAGSPESLHLIADGLLREPAELVRIRDAAYAFVRDELPLRRGVLTLLQAAESLRGAGAGRSSTPGATGKPPEPVTGPPQPPGRRDDPETARTALAAITERRRREREAVRLAGNDPDDLLELHRSPAHDAAQPRVTVCVPAYRATALVSRAMASVAAQDLRDIDVLVLDDGCPDGSGEVAAAWLREHPWLPGRVLARRCNAGLPAARNTMIAAARATRVLMLDADNELLPTCATRLSAALDAHPAATFAYPIIATRRGGEPDGLLSYFAWDPGLLRAFNPIDALALLRRDHILDLGGYTEDLELYGWEDYELWVHCAERGLHGVQVPQPLARYRRSTGSMLSITDLDQGGRMDLLRRRYPRTMAG